MTASSRPAPEIINEEPIIGVEAVITPHEILLRNPLYDVKNKVGREIKKIAGQGTAYRFSDDDEASSGIYSIEGGECVPDPADRDELIDLESDESVEAFLRAMTEEESEDEWNDRLTAANIIKALLDDSD